MPAKRHGLLTRIKNNLRGRMISGMLVLVPIGVTLLVMKWLFSWMAGFLKQPITRVLEYMQWRPEHWEVYASAVSIVALLVMLYFVGVIARMVVGRKLIGAAERGLMRIPLVKTVYGASKQVVETISVPEGTAFKAAVTIEFPAPGMRTLGFITGTIRGIDGREYYKVFIPTTPNITTGFFELVLPEKVQVTSMTVEEALRTVISGGLLAPERILPGVPPRRTGPEQLLTGQAEANEPPADGG